MRSKNNLFLDLELKPEDRLLVAYSGGPDSTYLLLQALDFFKQVYVAYVDYHDSPYVGEEEKIVEDFLKTHALKCFTLNVNLKCTESNFEEKARDIRYSFFKKVIQENKLKGVLVAHHANDDAETFLMQLKRGSLVKSYGLMPLSYIYGIFVYRPLLKLKRSAILDFLERHRIPFFNDPTNYNKNRVRDQIRMDVIKNEEQVDEIIKKKEDLQKELNTVKAKINPFLTKNSYSVMEYRTFSSNEQKRILYTMVRKLWVSCDDEKASAFTNILFEFLKSNRSGMLKLQEGVFFYKTKKVFFFGKELPKETYFYEIKEPGIYSFPEVTFHLSSPELIHIKKFPIFVRAVKKGDTLGTSLREKDPFKIMKKHHVPVFLKDRYPALFDSEGKIVYLPLDWSNDPVLLFRINRIKLGF